MMLQLLLVLEAAVEVEVPAVAVVVPIKMINYKLLCRFYTLAIWSTIMSSKDGYSDILKSCDHE